jgi:hypothetical protein
MDAPPTPDELPAERHIIATLWGTPSQPSSWDWTSVLPDTDHVRFFRSWDWGSTRLGPLQDFSPTLRQAVYQVLADSRPACLYWYLEEPSPESFVN